MNTNQKDKSSENVNKRKCEGKKCPAKLVLSEVVFEERTKNTENDKFDQSKNGTAPSLIKQNKILTQKNIVVKKCDEKDDSRNKIKKANNEEVDKIKSKKCVALKCPNRITPEDTQILKLSGKNEIIKCRAKTQSGTRNLSEQRGSSAQSTQIKSSDKNSLKEVVESPSKLKLQEKNKKSSTRICSAGIPNLQASKTRVSSKMEQSSYPKETKLKKYEVAKLSNACICPEIHPISPKKCSANKYYAQQKYSLRKSFLNCLSSLVTEIQRINIIPGFHKLQLDEDEIEKQAISINKYVCPYKVPSPVVMESKKVEITENIPQSSISSENEFSLKHKVTPCKSVCNKHMNEDEVHIVEPSPPITKPSLKFIMPPSTSLKNIESFVCPTICPSTQLSATNTEIEGIKKPCKSTKCTTQVFECKSVACNPKPKIICQSEVCGVKSEPGYVTERKPIAELGVDIAGKPGKAAVDAIEPEEALKIEPTTKAGEGIEVLVVLSETKIKEQQKVEAEVTGAEVISEKPGVKPVVVTGMEPFGKTEFEQMVKPEDRAEIWLDAELAAKSGEKLAEKLGVQPITKPGEKFESEIKPLVEIAVKPSIEPAVKPGDLVVKAGAELTVKPIMEPSVEEELGLKQLGEAAVKPSVEPAVKPGELVVKPGVESTIKPIIEPSVGEESILKQLGETAVKPSVEPAVKPGELVVKPGVESTNKPSVGEESRLKQLEETAVKSSVEPTIKPGELVVKPEVVSTVKPIIEPSVEEEPRLKKLGEASVKPSVEPAVKPGDLVVKPEERSKEIDSAVIPEKDQVIPREETVIKSGVESREGSAGLPAAKLDMEAATKLREDPAIQFEADRPPKARSGIPEVETKRQEGEKAELDKLMQPLDSKTEKPIGPRTMPGSETAKVDSPVGKIDMEHVTKLREDPASQTKEDIPKVRAGLIPEIVAKREEIAQLDKSMPPLDSKKEKPIVRSTPYPESESTKKFEELPVAKLDMGPATKLGKDPALQLKADTPKVSPGLIPGIEMKQQENKEAKFAKSMQPLDSQQDKKPETKTGTGVTSQLKPEVGPTTKQTKMETDSPQKTTDTKQKQLGDEESIQVDKGLKTEPVESKLSPAETITSKSELKPDTKQKYVSELDSVSKVEKVIGTKIDSPLAPEEVEAAIESGKVDKETLDRKEKSKEKERLDTGHERVDKQYEKVSDSKAGEKITKAGESAGKTEAVAYSESKIDKEKGEKKQKGKVEEARGKDIEIGEQQLKSKDFGKPDAQLDGVKENLKSKLDSKKIDTTTDDKSGQKKSQKLDTFDKKDIPELKLEPKADSKISDEKPHDEKGKQEPKPKVDSEKLDVKPQEKEEKTDLKSKAKTQKDQKIYDFDKEKPELTSKPKAAVQDIETKEKLMSAASDKKITVKPEEKTEKGEDKSKISKAEQQSERQTGTEKNVVSEKGEASGTKDTQLKQDREADEKLISESQLDETEKTTEQLSELASVSTDQVIAEEKSGIKPEEPEKLLDEDKKQAGKLVIEDKKGTEFAADDTETKEEVESRDAEGDRISGDKSVQKQKLVDTIKGRKTLDSETFEKESEGKAPAADSEKQIKSKSKIESEKLDLGQEAKLVDTAEKQKYVADESKKEHKDDVPGKGESLPETLKKATKCACTQLRSRKTKRPTTCFCDKGLVTELSDECTCHKLSKDKKYTCAQTETISKSFKSASCSTVEQNFRDRIRLPKQPDRHLHTPCRTEYLPINIEKKSPGAGQLESQSFSGVPIPRFKDTRRSYCKCREDPNFIELLYEMMEGTTKLIDSKRQEITDLLLHCTCDKNEDLDFAKVLLQLLDELGFRKKIKRKCSCGNKVHKRKLSKQGCGSCCTCPVRGPSKPVNDTNGKEKVGDIGKVRCVDTCSRKKCTCLSPLQRPSDPKLIRSQRKNMQ